MTTVDSEDLKNSVQEVQDSSDVEQVETQIASTQRELETFEKALEQAQKDKENFQEQYDVAHRIRELKKDQFRKIPDKIEWEYEQSEEYWELQGKLLEFHIRKEEFSDLGQLDRFDSEMEEIQKRIDFNKDKLERLQSLLEGDEE